VSEEVDGVRKRAVHFFWRTLIMATGASMAGNVAHALLNPAARNHFIAAVYAFVPPIMVLCCTHGVGRLVRARIVGGAYKATLAMTVGLGLCAFALSFEALRDVARTQAGYSGWASWIAPAAIDIAIAISTLALFALTGAPARNAPVHGLRNGAPLQHNGVQLHRLDAPVESSDDWGAQADELIGAGVTRIDRDKVAAVLAALAGGTAPSTVARNVGVGYATVARIADRQGVL
jgi:hypothetical protein